MSRSSASAAPSTTGNCALSVRSAHVEHADPVAALRALAEQLEPASASAVLLFCSASCDLERLGSAIERAFPVPTVACTSAGLLGPTGFESDGVLGICLSSADLSMRPVLLPELSSGRPRLPELERRSASLAHGGAFGVMLTASSTGVEEYVTAAAYQALGDVPLVGGSAAGASEAAPAAVYYSGRFHRDAAVLALFESETLPFATLRAHYFRPGAQRVVTTLADADARVIYELNGEPAASVYAELLGVAPAALDAARCAQNPLLLSVGAHSYVRSVKSVNADQSLSLHCAIEEGLVLSLGEPEDALRALSQAFDALPPDVAGAPLLLGFDSFLDREQLQARGQRAQVSSFLAKHRVRGFSGCGSQLGPIHFNQTLTCLAVGGAHATGRES